MAWCISQCSCTLTDDWCQWDIGQSTHVHTTYLITESVPIHKTPAATLLLNLQVLTTWECTDKAGKYLQRKLGILVFRCLVADSPSLDQQLHLYLEDKPSRRRCEQLTLVWCFTFSAEVSASAMCGTLKNQFSTQNWVGLNLSPSPAVLQRSCTAAWVLFTCHRMT